ncbi:MAG: M3 family oligoendopeptidase, partial [Bacteroidetes bacterium]|nr:M3 family oligoendopeptidase [Bacteroidota bacterium]
MPNISDDLPVRKKRRFLSEQLDIKAWEDVEAFFENLSNRTIDSKELLLDWIEDRSEMDAVLEEDLAWRYIKMNIDTTDKSLVESFQFFVENIEPKNASFSNEYDKKLMASANLSELGDQYQVYLKTVRTGLEIFREENIPLNTQLGIDSQEYGTITGAMSIEFEGEELTMQKAAMLLKDNDRDKRYQAYQKIEARRIKDKKALNKLFDKLIGLRNQVALNADY